MPTYSSAGPELASCASLGLDTRDSSGWLGAPREEADPLGTQLPPWVLERAASKAADFTAFGHPGGAPRV